MDKNKILTDLKKYLSEDKIYIDEPMSKHTSFKIGGNADIYVKAKTFKEIKDILNYAKINNIPLTIVGNGTNLLVRDNGIRGIVLRIDNDDLKIIENENNIEVIVGAGMLIGKLAQLLLKKEITGLEFAAGVPGTIGGAVRMNAGCFGGEFKDIVKETKYLDESGNIYSINNEEHEFSYRHSIFENKKNLIIVETTLKMAKGKEIDMKARMDEIANTRKEKQPLEFPSAGSSFRRGTDFVTAKLIDDCGLKGYTIGGAQISEKHAGFIINKGNATAKDVLDLVKYTKDQIKEKFQKEVELEIEVIGE